MGKGKLYEVEITAAEKDGEFEFTINSDLKHGKSKGGIAKFVFNKDNDKMHKKDSYLIQFVLTNGEEVGLRFPSHVRDALWVCRTSNEQTAGNGCPVEPCYIDEFRGLAVLNDYCLLAANRDSKVEWLVFTLNFVKDCYSDSDQENYVQWDPIGENQNGGKSLTE